MASLRAALFFSAALALVLYSQARPLEEVSPLGSLVDGELFARHLLQANSSEPCCSLYKKTRTDFAGFSAQARALANQQSNLLTSLLTQPSIKQAMIDFLAQADRTLTDDGTKLFGNRCLTQAQANTFGKNLLFARNIGKGVNSLNAINGLNVNILNLNVLGIPLQSFGFFLIQALQTFASTSDAISADLINKARTLSGCSV